MVPLTEDGIENYEWNVGGGLSIRPPVARWSPDGGRLAAYRVDSRKVQRQPLVHWLTSREEVDMDLNPLAGGELPQVEVYVIDVLSRRTVRVETGDQRDQYLYLIGWRPDGRELLYYRMSRDFRRLDLLAADPNTGKSRVILTETSKTFVEGYTDWPSLLFTPLWDRQQFLWLSERDGWEHIYLYGFDGQLVRRLTTGTFPVQRIVSVDRKAGWIYFSASSDPDRPYDSHLHRVNLEGQGFARLTKESGQHSVVIAPSGEYFLDTHADLDRPARVELMRADGAPLQVLAAADTSALAPLRRQPIERFVVKAADGITDLYGVLFKPFDFDPKRKYPVIEVFYPGDQINIVPRTFDLNYYGVRAQAWAQLGFITFVVDARGTPGRGKAFQDVVYLNHGKNEIPDHAAVVKQLVRQRPYMDSTRVGVWGHSWGGYFAIRAMLLAPDVYQVGVASAPLADLDATYWPTEPYMLTPQENAAGYDYAKNTRFADRLEGKLLMIVGSNDGAHLMGHVLRQAEAFIRAGKLFDMMILPEQNHGFTGTSARFAEQYVRAYFEKNLRVAAGAEPTSDR
jgi:dipeptidyl aminopeptidase/acylaminoacyl peptidase